MRNLFSILTLLITTTACGVSSPTAPATVPAPTAAPIALTELVAYNAPLEVFPGTGTQIHVGTFGRGADGSLRPVYDATCSFTSDGGRLIDQPAGTDTSWHVALVEIPKTGMSNQRVHVTASCGLLSTVVAFTVIPEGVLPPGGQPPTPTPTPTPTTPPTTTPGTGNK